jgi:nucleoside-diphosphate-sugar epimerase
MAATKRIAISGASGFVGLNLCQFLHSQDCELITFIRPSTNQKVKSDLELISKVIVLNDKLTESINKHALQGVDYVIHLASYAPAEHQVDDLDKLIDANIRLGLHLVNTASQVGARFLNIGTNWQHFEGATYSPVSLYAATKQALEDILEYFIQVTTIDAIQLDLSDTYGLNDSRDKLIPKLVRTVKNSEPLFLTKGDQLIDLVHVNDVVNAIWTILQEWNQHAIERKFSITSGKLITVRQLIEIFEEVSGVILMKQWGAVPENSRRMLHSMAIHSTPLNWKPRIDLASGIVELI